jgi:competence protein ComEC
VSAPAGGSAAPALLTGGGFATGVSLAAVGALPAGAATATALAGGVAGVAASLSHRWSSRSALAAAALLAAAFGMLRGAAMPGAGHLPLASDPVAVEGTVRDAPALRRGEALITVDAQRLVGAAGERGVEGGVLAAVVGHPDLAPGDRVRLDAAALRLPGDRAGPTSAALLQRDGVVAVAVSPRVVRLAPGGPSLSRALAALRARIAAEVDAALPPVAATLVTEIAFGIHGALPPDVSTALRDAGLVHLVATSGLKVAIVIGLLARLAGALGVGPRRRLLLIGAAVALYVGVAGGGAAAVRSALMAGAALLLRGSGRRLQPLSLLAVTAALMLALQPRLCTDVGFQLSFLGTLGILLLATPLARRLPGPRWLAEPFAVTVAAQLATVPVMASAFGVLSLVGPLANALVVPAVPPLVVLAWAGAALAWVAPAFGWPLLAAAGLAVSALLALARVLAALPLAALHPGRWPQAWTWAELAGLGAAALAWQAAAGRGRLVAAVQRVGGPAAGALGPGGSRWRGAAAGTGAAVVAAAVTLGVLSRPDGRLHVTVLDTGASMAALVRTADGSTALVDGGADPTRLQAALGRELPPLTRSLDLVVLTGGDRLAVAGLAGLPGAYRVDTVAVPDLPLGRGALDLVGSLRAAGAGVVAVPPGAAWSWHGASWRLLAGSPPGAAPARCALQVADGSGAALLLGVLATGDQEALAAAAGPSLASDLLVTPARGDVAPVLLAAVRPRLLAIPSARAPRLTGAGVRSTAVDGTLEYAGSPAGLRAA